MYTRRFNPNSEVIHYGKRFDKVYFITDGMVDLVSHKEKLTFMQL